MDLTVVAYATLALSLFVSAVKMGGWILNADPRAIINSGRWALLALAALTLGVLAWLIASGRWTLAMMLAAFMLPVFVQAAPRWCVLFGPLNVARSDFPRGPRDFGGAAGGFSSARGTTDPELVRRGVLRPPDLARHRGAQIRLGAQRAQPGRGLAKGRRAQDLQDLSRPEDRQVRLSRHQRPEDRMGDGAHGRTVRRGGDAPRRRRPQPLRR